jgi:hypothetical protein
MGDSRSFTQTLLDVIEAWHGKKFFDEKDREIIEKATKVIYFHSEKRGFWEKVLSVLKGEFLFPIQKYEDKIISIKVWIPDEVSIYAWIKDNLTNKCLYHIFLAPKKFSRSYTPGEWENYLNELYLKAKQIKR